MKLPFRYFFLFIKRSFTGYKFYTFVTLTLTIILLTQINYIKKQITQLDSLLIYGGSATTTTTTSRTNIYVKSESIKQSINNNNNKKKDTENKNDAKWKMLKNKIKELNRIRMKYNENRHYENFETNKTIFPINYNVHIFYYAWYENLRIDGKWEHWNHEYIKNWRKNDKRIYPRGRHVPPDDIGSNYYPKLGCYSSKDVYVINEHMKQISNAGIGL